MKKEFIKKLSQNSSNTYHFYDFFEPTPKLRSGPGQTQHTSWH